MSETTTQNNWPELYQEALLESDPMKVPARIEEAHQAIHRRALELWYADSPNTKEQRELNTALHFLDLLRMVGCFQVAHQLRDFQHTAYEMRRQAETLESFTQNRDMHWESHTYQLNALKDQVNWLGEALAKLEAMKPVATDNQRIAIEHARLHLISIAQKLEQAIALVNENRNNVYRAEYAEAVSSIYAHVDALHNKMDTRLEFEIVDAPLGLLIVEPFTSGER